MEIHKSVTNKIVMNELSLFLDRLEKEKCCELIKLYDELERQKYVWLNTRKNNLFTLNYQYYLDYDTD